MIQGTKLDPVEENKFTMDKYFKEARERMVNEQIVRRGIKDERVLAALRKIPRHKFVGEEMEYEAYSDHPLPIGNCQTISQPYMVALMTESLQLTGSEMILEIGTGSGYQTAILAELSSWVYTIEKFPDLLQKAINILRELGYNNFTAKTGDGTLGWDDCKPYDAIMVTAGSPVIPPALENQLAEGGRLLIPVGDQYLQELVLLTKENGKKHIKNLGGCRFVPLKGEQGWK